MHARVFFVFERVEQSADRCACLSERRCNTRELVHERSLHIYIHPNLPHPPGRTSRGPLSLSRSLSHQIGGSFAPQHLALVSRLVRSCPSLSLYHSSHPLVVDFSRECARGQPAAIAAPPPSSSSSPPSSPPPPSSSSSHPVDGRPLRLEHGPPRALRVRFIRLADLVDSGGGVDGHLVKAEVEVGQHRVALQAVA